MKLAALATAAALTALSSPAPAQEHEEGSLESLCQSTGRMAENVMRDRMDGRTKEQSELKVYRIDAAEHAENVMLAVVETAYNRDVSQPEDSTLTAENYAIMRQVLFGATLEGDCLDTVYWTDLD